ncbi:hypothetical protein ABLN67_00155, partial [Mycobacterium tuberculosis]
IQRPSFGYRFGCLTVSSIGGNGVFAFIVKRFRVFRAPLQLCPIMNRRESCAAAVWSSASRWLSAL